MRRREMMRAGGRFRGLWLDVDAPDAPDRPVLRVEAAAPRMLRVVQGDEVVLLGWVEPGHWGVDVARTGSYRSVVAPIRADEARRRAEVSTDAADWFLRWCHVFADALSAPGAAGPLHTGAWTLRPARVGGWALALLADRRAASDTVDPVVLDLGGDTATADAETYLDWDACGAADILPLRPLRAADTGRVKAHRKLVADGSLPPVLVWWIGGLTAPVVLDGHDRLAAAVAEGVAPPVVELAPVRGPDDVRPGEEGPGRAVEALLRLAEQGDTSSPHARALGVGVANEQLHTEERVRTIAWPIPGGAERWRADVALHVPGWVHDVQG